MSRLRWGGRCRDGRHKASMDLSTVASPMRCMRGASWQWREPEYVSNLPHVRFIVQMHWVHPSIVSLIVGVGYSQARCGAQHCMDE